MHPPRRKGQSCSAGAADTLEIKIRQLQQYLHRPGQLPAAPHLFVKQAARQAAKQRSQPHRPPSLGQQIGRWRDRLVGGGSVTYYTIAIGVPAVIASLFRHIRRPAKRQLTHPQPRLSDAEAQSSIACQLCSKPQNKL